MGAFFVVSAVCFLQFVGKRTITAKPQIIGFKLFELYLSIQFVIIFITFIHLNLGIIMKTNRFVITVIGVDTVGIVAGVTRVMSDFGVNIIDIRQTLMEDIFTMLMIGEVKNESFVLKDFQDKMTEVGQSFKVEIRVQHEDVFKYMHRI